MMLFGPKRILIGAGSPSPLFAKTPPLLIFVISASMMSPHGLQIFAEYFM